MHVSLKNSCICDKCKITWTGLFNSRSIANPIQNAQNYGYLGYKKFFFTHPIHFDLELKPFAMLSVYIWGGWLINNPHFRMRTCFLPSMYCCLLLWVSHCKLCRTDCFLRSASYCVFQHFSPKENDRLHKEPSHQDVKDTCCSPRICMALW